MAGRALGLLLVLVFAVGVRLPMLNARGIWFDEAFSIYIARITWSEAIQQLRLFDPHPPLYYIILRKWIRLGTGLAEVRAFSMLAGTLAVLATVALGARLGGWNTGLLAGSLVSGSAFAIQASVEARMYPLLSLFVVLATWLLVEVVCRSRRPILWAVYVLVMALAVYVDYFAWLVLAAHGTYVLIYHRRRRAARLGFIAAGAVTVLLFVPWLPVTAEQLGTGRFATTWKGTMPVNAPLNIVALSSFGGYLLGLGGYLFPPARDSGWQVLLILPYLALATLGVLPRDREREGEGALLILTWGLPVVLLIVTSVITNTWYAIPRYTGFLQPVFALLLVRGLVHLIPRRPVVAAVGAAIIVALNIGVLRASAADPRFQIFDWAGAARYVERGWATGDVLVFYPAGGRIAFGYHFHRPITDALILSSSWKPRLSKEEWARTLPPVPALVRGAPRIWLVLTMPVSPAAVGALRESIEAQYRRVEEQDFQYVWVFLYEKRPPIGTG
jgi:uncharacterized membrane protein